MDDNGLIEGKWDGSFEDGTSPFAWIGSTPIFEEFYNTQLPVKYGQCWVFSGVIVTSEYIYRVGSENKNIEQTLYRQSTCHKNPVLSKHMTRRISALCYADSRFLIFPSSFKKPVPVRLVIGPGRVYREVQRELNFELKRKITITAID